MQHVLDQLHRGRVVVLDGALGDGVASAVLNDTKRLLSAGLLLADSPLAVADEAVRATGGAAALALRQMLGTVYEGAPGLWDSFRLIAWLDAQALHSWNAAASSEQHRRRYLGLATAVSRLRALLSSIGAAELSTGKPLSPAWPADGLGDDPDGSLLSVNGFNGTRYALHTDAASRTSRKLTCVYYPHFDPPWQAGDGGELAVPAEGAAGQHEVRLSPRADRLLLFNSEVPHQVLPSRIARISLTLWGVGRGARLRPAPRRLDTSHQCTSDLCRRAARAAAPSTTQAATLVGSTPPTT